jgi:hypothetical protein
MNQATRTVFAGFLLASTASLTAQANTVPGLDGKLYNIDSPTVWGREGAAHPNGQVGFSAANYMCNPGSVTIPWFAAMQENHPMFGFMVTRLTDDRMVQVSDRSMCKHAFTSINGSSGPCLPCQNPGTGTVMGIGCYDVYGAGNNGSRTWLGPADEINPWLGTWQAVGSYFDRGDPDVGPPNNNDGVRSTIFTNGSVVKNRVTLQEQDLLVPNSQFFYMIHLLHRGEDVSKRNDNIMSRGVSFNWSGSSWNESNVGTAVQGTVLNRWPGASLTMDGNGNDDGRIAIAVKVTGPTNGMWHYEYAVHNIDNSRGAASFRLPICSQARVQNLGFRDIDDNSLNQWTATVQNGEIAFSAPTDNALRWNMLFNFWFDSDAAPSSGLATFDEALIGPGALSFTVPTQVPGDLANVYLGDGCGSSPQLRANGVATIPAPTFALDVQATPFTSVGLFLSFGQTTTPLAPGCNQYLDGNQMYTVDFRVTGVTGAMNLPLPIPATLLPIQANFQAATLETGGPVMGAFGLSNGLGVRIGLSGCP